jgi:hypothetical protein
MLAYKSACVQLRVELVGLSRVGLASCTYLVNGFGVGQARQYGRRVNYRPHGHASAD